ncbi:uncharacterized protein PFL1_04651 [Pseudozyma flocculosa PF-1]|uniref:Related to potassium/hydrogen antiporter n=2 Tax=Pseudozyma flocculosa TaxID=84751 RepID=A0A5C3FBP5_9BASI|nr:uncharacterized protein PFL1_04651 [Pseudozyma flocculosa PF-1]EPQ27907.1 hypothetical protein PFL1_04651 [Pseudozyma flocculosa PF-1]SPO41690.1 related to potassium/hydrogen antiporter [Pseudozyma flocculosa]
MPSPDHGWLSGVDPLTFDPSNSIDTTNGFALFLTQVTIIIALCQILGKIFQRIGQPAVVGELLAGILLGPTAFGNIPGFTSTIIPPSALGLLKLLAGIGLSLFLFLVGLETDTDLMAKYWKKVAIITLPGMAIPFAVSVGIARLIWQLETDQTVQFTTFFLFVGTVMAVTSLSVLSRIMAEMGILSTTLGSITIAAGVCNDLIGYILLALGSALGTGGKQINALYELLTAAGYIAALWFGFRPLMMHLIGRSGFNMAVGAGDRVPEHLLVIALVGALVSAFFTDSIGVHPIVGAFAFGVCCPHGNFAVKVTESIETLVIMVLLPLYFVTSGLSTDFKLLDSGKTWGLIFLLVVGIFVSKFGATALSARFAGMPWRQAMCVASLMQSKGIIEIIILNVALQLEVVSPRVFAMMVTCFLCTTITVRPLSRRVYFSTLQQEEEKAADAANGEGTGRAQPSGVDNEKRGTTSSDFPITVAITSPNPAIQALMSLINVLGHPGLVAARGSADAEMDKQNAGHIALDLIRLLPIEYTTSSIMQLITYSDDRRRDEMLESLKTVQRLHAVPTSGELAAEHDLLHGGPGRSMPTATLQHEHQVLPPDTFTVPRADLTDAIAKQHAKAMQRLRVSAAASGNTDLGGGLVVVSWEVSSSFGRGLSWLGAAAAASGLSSSQQSAYNDDDAAGAFWQADSDAHALPSRIFTDLRRTCTTGVLIDRGVFDAWPGTGGVGSAAPLSAIRSESLRREEARLGLQRPGGRRRILVPFFGGADDRAAVELLQCIVSASEGDVDGVVISAATLSDTIKNLASQPARARTQKTTEEEERVAEEENQASINLQTVYQAEAARADARFLFGQQAILSTVHEQADAPSPSSASAEVRNDDGDPLPAAQTTDGVHFVALPLSPEATPGNVRPIRSILTSLLSLVDGERDMVLVGRGKLGQRPKEFRAEVEAMHRDADGAAVAPGRRALVDEAKNELKIMGRTLGAATEGLLLGGLTANLLVVQAKKRNE